MNNLIISILIAIVFAGNAHADEMSDYLLLQDIGGYKLRQSQTNGKEIPSTIGPKVENDSGTLKSVGHVNLDNKDKTYKALYIAESQPTMTVQVTQHDCGQANWVQHELENLVGQFSIYNNFHARVMNIEGNKVLASSDDDFTEINSIAWISKDVVVHIQYNSDNHSHPGSVDIARAYLTKFPSSLTILEVDLLSKAHSEAWVRNEMSRRLWLCDKWIDSYGAGMTTKGKLLYELFYSMGAFLNYAVNVYGYSSLEEMDQMWIMMNSKDLDGMKAKLSEYKQWWAKQDLGRLTSPL